MENIYCISGLGADQRLFEKLRFQNYELKPVNWIPYNENDNLVSYAARLSETIHQENAIVIGLSFGGMLAVEMAKQKPDWRIFIVSSARISKDVKWQSFFNKTLSEWKIVPKFFFNLPTPIQLSLLGAETLEQKKLLTDIIRKSDPGFMRWSVNALLHWQNNERPKNVVHIHGTKDKMLFPVHCQPEYWIAEGTHLMIYNRADEVSKMINQYLQTHCTTK